MLHGLKFLHRLPDLLQRDAHAGCDRHGGHHILMVMAADELKIVKPHNLCHGLAVIIDNRAVLHIIPLGELFPAGKPGDPAF